MSLSFEAQVAWLTLVPDRPGRPPTLDHAALDALDAAVKRVAEAGDDVVAAVVGAQEPGKYFCVGADVAALAGLNEVTIVPWVRHGHEVFNRLAGLPVPVVAAVDGYALGGGLELALACDVIVATRTSRFGATEARLGAVPGWGGTGRLPARVGLGRARLLTFTGRLLVAEEAAAIGLVDVLTADPLHEAVAHLLAEMREAAPHALRQVKRLLGGSLTRSGGEVEASVVCFGHDETKRRVEAFLASRAAAKARS
ncbi:MAG: enoyl-CoA hydratase/isomerase family protein [Phycisphaerae bacterium]